MYVKYKENQGELLRYEYIENTSMVIADIRIDNNSILRVTCKSNELKIPNIMGNYYVLDK